MNGISQIDFFEKGGYELDLYIKKGVDDFQLYFGKYSLSGEFLGELEETGASFSGQDGYLFDQDGTFFGGYKPQKTFKLKVIKKNYNKFSYYFNDTLIANDLDFGVSGINAIKFSDYGNSQLAGSSFSRNADNVSAGTFGEFLQDNLDNLLYSEDNILLISHL